MLAAVFISLCWLHFSIASNFTSFYDETREKIGLRNEKGDECLSIAVEEVMIINLNLNTSNNKVPFDLPSSTVSGHCSNEHGEREATLKASLKHDNRERELKFFFTALSSYVVHVWVLANAMKFIEIMLEGEFRRATYRKRVHEEKTVFEKKAEILRWELSHLVYTESYDDNSVIFVSDNSTIIITAPLSQKYLCRDTINVTLHNNGFQNVIVQLLPEMDFQPFGPRSNFYLCARTRGRTLKESFRNRATVFSGVVLGLSSMGAIIGHILRRHFIPERKEMYENLGS